MNDLLMVIIAACLTLASACLAYYERDKTKRKFVVVFPLLVAVISVLTNIYGGFQTHSKSTIADSVSHVDRQRIIDIELKARYDSSSLDSITRTTGNIYSLLKSVHHIIVGKDSNGRFTIKQDRQTAREPALISIITSNKPDEIQQTLSNGEKIKLKYKAQNDTSIVIPYMAGKTYIGSCLIGNRTIAKVTFDIKTGTFRFPPETQVGKIAGPDGLTQEGVQMSFQALVPMHK